VARISFRRPLGAKQRVPDLAGQGGVSWGRHGSLDAVAARAGRRGDHGALL
jgi:hypothetical protein